MAEQRLQKAIASAGICSRRKAEDLIAAGRVAVNGRVVERLGVKVDPGRDRIAVDGRRVAAAAPEYWMLHKPVGVVASLADPWGRATAQDYVRGTGRVFPVGRLDADSAGLLLLTNDGDVAHALTRPEAFVEHVVHLLVAGRLRVNALRRLRREATSGARATAPPLDAALLCRTLAGDTWVQVRSRGRRTRDVRRLFHGVGHSVMAMRRVGYAGLVLGGLAEGTVRRLSHHEREMLRAAAAGVAAAHMAS